MVRVDTIPVPLLLCLCYQTTTTMLMLIVFLHTDTVDMVPVPVLTLAPAEMLCGRPTGSALAAASDIHRQVTTYMADIRRDWLTNQNTD